MKLVCLGDSLTYGYGVPRRDTWVRRSAERTGLELVNAGISGDTTGGMLARFQRDVFEQSPRAVLIMGGGNDLMTGCPAFVPQSNLMGMTHQALNAGISVLVGVPVPVWREGLRADWAAFARSGWEKEAEAYQAWLLHFGGSFGIPVVDFGTPFDALRQSREAGAHYLDGLHPSPRGHVLMAEIFCAALAETGLWRAPAGGTE